MISYAQNFEDVILERFFKEQKSGFYVDIGAADPVMDSVTKHLYDKGWRGINIEPSPQLFVKLVLERTRDINLNCLCSNQDNLNTFFNIPNSGLSTVYQNLAVSAVKVEGQKDYEGNAINSFEKILIESRKLSSILEHYANNFEIDFLKIDVEGSEKEVIESNDWSLFRPKIIIVESTIPSSQIANFQSWDNILISSDYFFVYFDGLNRFYLRNDLIDFKEVFSYPPCVFDEFIKNSEINKQIQLNEFHLQQIELQSDNQKLLLNYQDLKTHHHELQSQHRNIQAQNIDLILQNHELTNKVNAILNSYTWRIIKPLRWILDLSNYIVRSAFFS